MEKFLANKKMIAISGGCFALLLAIVITAACLMSTVNEPEDDALGVFNDGAGETTAPDLTPEEWKIFLFEESADSCKITGLRGEIPSDIIIPALSPAGLPVTEIADNAFANAAGVETVSIPETVSTVSPLAFSSAEDLVAINVNSKNQSFSSVGGVLYSKDKTTLVCYPAAKVGRSFLLSTSLKVIGENAFANVANLKSIYYEGSMSKFSSIEVAEGNEIFLSLPVTCNYVSSK